MKLVSFILMLTVVLLEAKLNFWGDSVFSRKAVFNYLFSKNYGVVRVRKPEEVKTAVNNVTTLDFIGLVEKNAGGYSAEEHYVITEDGYILMLHRIFRNPLFKSQGSRKVVFIQHGMMATSDIWVLIGAGKDLAFLLVDKGYDVWLGNFRGNAYCRSHIKLSPQNKEFWQFSYHEMGTRDLPAMIDYVLNYTKQKTIYYIGHSMVTTALFTLLSMKSEYNAKIKLGICLAPIAIWKEIAPFLEHIPRKIPKSLEFLESNEIYELAALSSTNIRIGRTLCTDKAITQTACIAIIFLICGSNPVQLNTTTLPEIFSYFPAGVSLQTIHHFYQNIINEKFQAFDNGYFDNYKKYGQMMPIMDDLKKVTAPLALYYSVNDLLAPKSVKIFLSFLLSHILMIMGIKLVFIVFMLTVVILEAKLNLWENLAFPQKVIFNYLFPKDPGIVRVRKPEQIQTANNVTTLDFAGLVERYGYPTEEHYVITEDGYILVIHRILRSPLSKDYQRKKVVFLQHGLICSSDCWVMIGPEKDLAFLLADKGYDVWLGNFRGTSYCRSHTKISTRNKEFWQFSYHEMGTRDLPIMIDYVLRYTKQQTLRYIGHSMGTTTLFILLSMKPEYNAKIKLGICLGPVAIWKKRIPLPENIFNKIPKIMEFLYSNEIYELASLSSTSITVGRTLCKDKAITQTVCVAIIFLLFGFDPEQFNTSMVLQITSLPEILSNYPNGASVRTLEHYVQNIVTKKFQTYDYGYADSYQQYERISPLTYDLKKITTPLALFYGANDMVALKPNVLETYKHLPNVILLEENQYKLFTHLDFLWAIDVKTLLYDRLIEVLQKFDNDM
ncbi:LIP3 Lipase, partial [Pseudoatta argentina]